jgi:hypothetical protein
MPDESYPEIFDPREYDWYVSDHRINRTVTFRSYVFDVLSLAVESDAK